MKSGEVSVEDTRKNIMKLLEGQNKEYGDDLVNRGWREDRCEQARNYLTMFVGARAAWVIMSGTEAVTSFFEGKGNMAGAVGVAPKGALYTQEPGGKIRITPQGMKAIDNSSAGSAKLSPEDYEKIGKLTYSSQPDAKIGDMHAPDASSEIAKPRFEDIAAVEIKAGGSMWGSIENNIKANPSAYGLDSNNPNFTKDMHRITQQMLDEFAWRKGMSYEQLDQIARTKLRAGDTFKIIYNPSTEEISLDDFHGKAFGMDVSHHAPAEEIASSKSRIAPEDMRPRTGAAEHQPSKGGGKMKLPQEILDNERIAKENWAKASQYYENIQDYKAKVGPQIENMSKEALQGQFLPTRSLLNRVFEGASFGDKANVWGKSAASLYNQIMSHGGYIAHDVISADAVKELNENNIRLMAMFIKFGEPRPGQNMNDYLLKIVANSRNIPILNTFISGDIEKLIGRPIK